ncbi:MAG: hypothetical protein JSV13_01755 [Nitrospiraceae bacterium]|nr:MAG: hypothetical protein JSV13_01755 [Nitrospiraceae bacterium]
MGIKKLAEGIILQSIEDLWDTSERGTSEQFFDSDGVSICAELADMSLYDEVKLFNMVQDILKNNTLERSYQEAIGQEKTLH